MAESIFLRVKRLVSGSIEDAVDAMERAGGTAVMREAIREVERAIDDVKKERDDATVRRLQAVRQQTMFQERLDALTEKAKFALEEGREDLAEVALTRQMDFEEQIDNLVRVEAGAGEEERELEEGLAQLEVRAAHMQEELEAFEAARVEAGLGKDGETGVADKSQRRIDRAEAAFERAMKGAGGNAGVSAMDVKASSSMAELNKMQKSAKVAERMEALRSMKKAG